MTFHPDRITAHGESRNFKPFQNYPYGFGDLTLKRDISQILAVNVLISRDNILQNRAGVKISTMTDFFSVEFGPFTGTDDSFSQPELGIMGGMQIAYPGIAFLSINGSSSLGTRYEFFANNFSETAEVKIGLWLPNVIPSFSINTKSYSRQIEDSATIRDELTRLQVSADFFAKNFPITVRFDAGYGILTRSYKRDFSDVTDELNSIFAGVEVKWQVTKPLRIIAGFEIPIMFTAKSYWNDGTKLDAPMETPDNRFNLYRFHGGVAYTFF